MGTVPKVPPPRKPKAKSAATDPLAQAVGRGNLTTSAPGAVDDDIRDDAVLRKEDFVWSEHEFNDGEKEKKVSAEM